MSTFMSTLKLQRFSLDLMKPYDSAVVIGKRGVGKTVLMADIWHHFKDDFQTVKIVDPVYHHHAKYPADRSEVSLHDSFSTEIIAKLILNGQGDGDNDDGNDNDNDNDNHNDDDVKSSEKKKQNQCLILDCCDFDGQLCQSSEFKTLLYNSQRCRTMILLGLQYCMQCKIGFRNSVDWAFLLQENMSASKRRLYEYFGGMFSTYEQFSKAFDAATGDYKCLVIHFASTSSKLEEIVFWHKADVQSTEMTSGTEPGFTVELTDIRALSPSDSRIRNSADQQRPFGYLGQLLKYLGW